MQKWWLYNHLSVLIEYYYVLFNELIVDKKMNETAEK